MQDGKNAASEQGTIIRNVVKPEIAGCAMKDCAFNSRGRCHALAINVGDDHPRCDTYSSSAEKAGQHYLIGGVGACKVTRCSYNGGMLCGAPNISIARHNDHADCLMYKEGKMY